MKPDRVYAIDELIIQNLVLNSFVVLMWPSVICDNFQAKFTDHSDWMSMSQWLPFFMPPFMTTSVHHYPTGQQSNAGYLHIIDRLMTGRVWARRCFQHYPHAFCYSSCPPLLTYLGISRNVWVCTSTIESSCVFSDFLEGKRERERLMLQRTYIHFLKRWLALH